ncbi:hypothetical protein CO153_01550 [Candidatus Pacearchaeota archaeon CG_4_9_14_3_um_filter_30_11]|nr:MAG: hypothetical protein COV77_02290 [Candidatus Pacearchaeota archaeon CG11_big_fil_rev_8_21_14_0_20_30_13]PJA71432.1 MAG: hypothetical protein CO153_01550 [Candidatus Pacearchaeota archaeon CG_4_9_14_3_um_filter_30_11]
MTILERILELKKTGIPDSEITKRLKNEGIHPMDISDAMNQSKIKEAVSGETGYSTQGMVPSIMGGESYENESSQEGTYSPSSSPKESEDYQDYSSQESESYQNSYPEEEYEDNYAPNEFSGGGIAMSSETMIEVAEQVFSEKIKKIETDLKLVKEFKTLALPAIKDFDERLKRMERQFDKMQIAILERVGQFGKNLDSVKKEIEMVEDSFEKLNKSKK